MKHSNSPFGKALKEILEKKRVKLRSLAKKTNLNYSYFSKLKKTIKAPPIKTIEIIADGLKIPPEYFLEYRIYKIEKALLDNPEIIESVNQYINNLLSQRELRVADHKKPFKNGKEE
ncbi:MAG: helix-turn-helix transcriptional regulator [Actinobacteria bacterium]|nr:helix-turn-helix transcriptional regulator [Actinomycetota bacterium]